MTFFHKIFGRPLGSWEAAKEKLGVPTGTVVLGLDPLTSIVYGPEAVLLILTPLGVAGLAYLPFIVAALVLLLAALYLSYRQTIAAYPSGGGAYIVAKDNFGTHAGLWAGVALLVDYILTVAVGIAAGVGAVVSAIPALHDHTLLLCLLILATLTIINLRGVRAPGLAFLVPCILFIGFIVAAIVMGVVSVWQSGGHPQPAVPLPLIPKESGTVGVWLLVAAFANGCVAMTGVEAVSNGVPLFREPTVRNAQWTLTLIVVILALFLLGLGFLCPMYHIGAMGELQPGYQSLLSQLFQSVAGRGLFYNVAVVVIFMVLMVSCQSSFADFPRVCRLLAEDNFLPSAFANRGRRLVFSQGIIILAILAGLILIAFGGATFKLLPLYAIGAFTAFFFSQAGMVVYWKRKPGRGTRTSLVFNALGAVATGAALVTIVIVKFLEGAWITIVIIPGLVLLLHRIHQHYERIIREVDRPIKLKAPKLQPPIVVIPVDNWNRVTEAAVRFGMFLSDDIIAVHVVTENDDPQRLRVLWQEKVQKPAEQMKTAIPHLALVYSPYRLIHEPILDFVNQTKEKVPDRLIAVVIPEVVEPHWYEYVLHSLHAARLRALLFLERDQRTVVISVPWYLREDT